MKEKNILNYTLFVTFFPHLIAGPILHHREIMPQFANDATYCLDSRKVASGLTLFAFGLIKKVVLADSIAPWAEAGFAHPEQLGMLTAWSTILAYSMQLYFDFSGYSDMAIGLSYHPERFWFGKAMAGNLPLHEPPPWDTAHFDSYLQDARSVISSAGVDPTCVVFTTVPNSEQDDSLARFLADRLSGSAISPQ